MQTDKAVLPTKKWKYNLVFNFETSPLEKLNKLQVSEYTNEKAICILLSTSKKKQSTFYSLQVRKSNLHSALYK